MKKKSSIPVSYYCDIRQEMVPVWYRHSEGEAHSLAKELRKKYPHLLIA